MTPLDLGRYPLAPLPDSAGQDPVPFGTVEVPGDRPAAEQYLTDVGEPWGCTASRTCCTPDCCCAWSTSP